jgi:uncharacterized membrane protein YhaH (DUF805 family)
MIWNYYVGVLKNYAKFDGRARRSEYWYYVLVNVIFIIALGLISDMLSNIYAFATLVPSIAVAIRRMHDVGKSGWYLLIPIYNLVLACTAGETGPNQYGPDPKNPAADLSDHLVV